MYFLLARVVGLLGIGYYARARKDSKSRRALGDTPPRGAKPWTGEEYFLIFSGFLGMVFVAALSRVDLDPNVQDSAFLLAFAIWIIGTAIIRHKLSEAFRR